MCLSVITSQFLFLPNKTKAKFIGRSWYDNFHFVIGISRSVHILITTMYLFTDPILSWLSPSTWSSNKFKSPCRYHNSMPSLDLSIQFKYTYHNQALWVWSHRDHAYACIGSDFSRLTSLATPRKHFGNYLYPLGQPRFYYQWWGNFT